VRIHVAHDAPGFRIPAPAVAAGFALAVLGLVVAATIPTAEGPVICPFRAVTGLPCPSCGLLRSASAILTGHPGAAFITNPLAAFFLIVVAPTAGSLWGLRRWRGMVVRVAMSRRERTAAWTVLIVAVALNWAYVLATHG
jgi:hypothetical protein